MDNEPADTSLAGALCPGLPAHDRKSNMMRPNVSRSFRPFASSARNRTIQGVGGLLLVIAGCALIMQSAPASSLDQQTASGRTPQQQSQFFQQAMELDRIGAKVEARKMMRSSCYDDRSGEACHNFAMMADLGEGGAVDTVAARDAFANACDLNILPSCYNLAGHMRRGRGGPEAMPEARRIYVALCKQRDPQSCHDLGLMAERGLGAPAPDMKKAVESYQTSCDANYRHACKDLDKGGHDQ